MMRPSVYTDFVAGHVLFYEELGALNAAGTYHKECGSKVLSAKVLQEFSRI